MEQQLTVGVVAVDDNWGIGKNNSMPWYNKSDFKWFKSVTQGNAVVMGRNTWDSLPVKPLPNRDNYVLTSDLRALEGFKVKHPSEGIGNQIKCVIGGLKTFKHYIDEIDMFLVSRIRGKYGCDVYFDKGLLEGFNLYHRLTLGKGSEDEFDVDIYLRGSELCILGRSLLESIFIKNKAGLV